MKKVCTLLWFCIFSGSLFAGAPEIIPFKDLGQGGELTLHVFTPPGHDVSKPVPGIVLFFGGGWVQGKPGAMYSQAQYLASRGMVAISAQYRTKSSHGTFPDICVMDGRSAMRYVRAHAAELGIDPDQLLAGGGSAGGHVAACTALEGAPNDPADDLTVSPKPVALVLFNPVLDVGPEGYGHGLVKNNTPDWEAINPYTKADGDFPPSIIQFGTKDKILPVERVTDFQKRMQSLDVTCTLKIFEGAAHSFFNHQPFKDATLYQVDLFLENLGYIKGESPLQPEVMPLENE